MRKYLYEMKGLTWHDSGVAKENEPETICRYLWLYPGVCAGIALGEDEKLKDLQPKCCEDADAVLDLWVSDRCWLASLQSKSDRMQWCLNTCRNCKHKRIENDTNAIMQIIADCIFTRIHDTNTEAWLEHAYIYACLFVHAFFLDAYLQAYTVTCSHKRISTKLYIYILYIYNYMYINIIVYMYNMMMYTCTISQKVYTWAEQLIHACSLYAGPRARILAAPWVLSCV
jgi:hypothetical protein